MRIKELLEKRLLMKASANSQEIEASLKIAKNFLEKANGNLKIEYYDIALSLAYQSMFHSARTLLFKNSFKERSHWATIMALKELYSQNNELLSLLEMLDSYRITRHAVQYNGIGCSKEDAIEAINDAKKLFVLVQSILAKGQKNS